MKRIHVYQPIGNILTLTFFNTSFKLFPSIGIWGNGNGRGDGYTVDWFWFSIGYFMGI